MCVFLLFVVQIVCLSIIRSTNWVVQIRGETDLMKFAAPIAVAERFAGLVTSPDSGLEHSD